MSPTRSRVRTVLLLAAPLLLAATTLTAPAGVAATAVTTTYTNPLKPKTSTGTTVQNCADPSVLRGRGGEAGTWYMYCTSDPLNDKDTSGSGGPVFRRLPTLRSRDLVHWTYVGQALPGRPSWATSTAKLWAPDVVYSSTYDRYYLTFAVTDTVASVSGEPRCDTDPAIGVAVASKPTGPWRTLSAPLVAPRRTGSGCSFASTIDPDVLGGSVGRQSTIYYGGFRDGLQARPVTLTSTGMRTTGSETRVSIGRRYEAANVLKHGDWYYLTASSGSCCNGAMSGYGVFAGRSRSPYGPFVDREGASMLDARTGGTPMLVMNGNRWIGPGHSSVFPDAGGQWWAAYHAVDRADPYFATETGFTRRPPMLDAVDWVDGWPVVRAGRGPSSTRMAAPAGQRGQVSAYRPSPPPSDEPGAALDAYSDEFGGTALDERWSWVRKPAEWAYAVEGGRLRLDTDPGQLYVDQNTAPVLTEPAPSGDFVAETVVELDVPATGCCYDAAQAGLVVYRSDDSYVKLTHAVLGEARVTSLAEELPRVPAGHPRYGSTTAGPPGEQTWLRIVRRTVGGVFVYRAYTSRDGTAWVRGGTWSDPALTDPVRLGFLALGRDGYTAHFSHLRVWRLRS
jgi:arabinan endo-1,5-alpha-L-arabinosidase